MPRINSLSSVAEIRVSWGRRGESTESVTEEMMLKSFEYLRKRNVLKRMGNSRQTILHPPSNLA